MSDELLRRVSSPRVVLWLGRQFDLDAVGSLRSDLQRLPLIAVFSEPATTGVERALFDTQDRVEPRYPVAVTNLESLEVVSQSQLPIYYLSGAGGGARNSTKQRRLRDAMVGELERLAEERPIYCALGLADAAELAALQLDLGAYDVEAPLFIVGLGQDEVAKAAKQASAHSGELIVLPHHAADDWKGLIDWAAAHGSSFLATDEGPSMRVGSETVPLGPIFADDRLKIDDQVRIVTSRALHAPPQANLNSLFDAFMAPDERAHARNAIDDLAEWHAIDANVPVVRPFTQERIEVVLGALKKIASGKISNAGTICWLPTEPGAGATSLLHQIAHAVAWRGYPTLVVKQLADEVSARSISDFLNEVRAGVRAALQRRNVPDANPPETPALLVLDTPHAGTEGLEDLPSQLTQREKRQVITLWALPVEAGHARVPPGMQPDEWYSGHALVHSVRRPRSTDIFLQPLEEHVSDEELRALERHAMELRNKRGVGRVEVRDEQTWGDFQAKSGFKGRGVIHARDDNETVEQWTRAESLFWAGLYHFLTNRESVDPYAHYRDTLRKVCHELGRDGALVLLQIAKASAMGLPLPDTALRDLLGSHSEAQTKTGAAPVASQATPSTMADQIEQLRSVWKGTRPRPTLGSLDVYQLVRRLVSDLERLNLVRSLVLDGVPWLRITHRAVAKALLAAACDESELLHALGLGDEPDACALVLGRDHAYRGLRPLLKSMTLSTSNVRFCELLSLDQLQGTGDDREDWKSGEGERRVAVYEDDLSPTIRQASRALLHHYANVLRNSVRFPQLEEDVKVARLRQAEALIGHALDQPWISGRRDEHPGHLLTTQALVRLNLSERKVLPAERHRLRKLAQETFESAFAMVPDSKHTRMGLADMLLGKAEYLFAEQTDGAQTESAALTVRVLQLLEIEPPDRPRERTRWMQAKERANRLFGSDAAMTFLQRLQQRGIEDGFLLVAEQCIGFGDIKGAIQWLAPIADGLKAARHIRSARRLAELYAQDDAHARRFEERYRLLAAVEASATRTTPDEEYQLACLEFQLGRYQRGVSRFAALRAAGRHRQVSFPASVLIGPKGEPRVFTGRIVDIENQRGYVDLFARGERDRLFRTEFFVRHFDRVRVGASIDVAVRFQAPGPQAVPLRFLGDA